MCSKGFIALAHSRSFLHSLSRKWAGAAAGACRGNHNNIFADARVEAQKYRYFDPETVGLDFDGMMADLGSAPEGSVVVLHACAQCAPGPSRSLSIACIPLHSRPLTVASQPCTQQLDQTLSISGNREIISEILHNVVCLVLSTED